MERGWTAEHPDGPPLETVVRPRVPLSLTLTVGPLRHGRTDPTIRFGEREAWRVTRTPDGPALEQLVATAGGHVEVRAWGPGAERAIAAAPALLGEPDACAGFEPRHPLLRELRRRFAGLRVGRTGAVFESLLPAVLEQKVSGPEAHRSYRELAARHGEPAPAGPAPARGMRLAPAAAVLATLPSWAFHRAGVEARRSATIRGAAQRADRLEALAELPAAEAASRMRSLPGIGAWTAAEVTGRALGDPDAVPVGDLHLPDLVAWMLAGEPRGDDERMLELLEPYRPHRLLVLRLLEATGWRPPLHGPRAPIRDIRGM